MTGRWRLLVAALTAGVVLAGCGQATAPSGPAAGSPSGAGGGLVAVVASTDVWADIATTVGGDAVTVTAIIADPAGDPHSYQATAKDAAVLRSAELVISNGGGYDPFVDQVLGGDGQRRVVAVDQHPETENEHVWYDLPTVAQVAGEIAAQLSQLRPAAKATFIANADAFDRKLDELEGRVSDLGTLYGGTEVAATEPVAHYLLADAKLADATPAEFVEAVEEETDPPAGAVADTQRLIDDRKVALLVHNPQTETPVVADVIARARAAGVPVVEMTETLPDGQDYLTWIGNQIEALAAVLTAARAPQ